MFLFSVNGISGRCRLLWAHSYALQPFLASRSAQFLRQCCGVRHWLHSCETWHLRGLLFIPYQLNPLEPSNLGLPQGTYVEREFFGGWKIWTLIIRSWNITNKTLHEFWIEIIISLYHTIFSKLTWYTVSIPKLMYAPESKQLSSYLTKEKVKLN